MFIHTPFIPCLEPFALSIRFGRPGQHGIELSNPLDGARAQDRIEAALRANASRAVEGIFPAAALTPQSGTAEHGGRWGRRANPVACSARTQCAPPSLSLPSPLRPHVSSCRPKSIALNAQQARAYRSAAGLRRGRAVAQGIYTPSAKYQAQTVILGGRGRWAFSRLPGQTRRRGSPSRSCSLTTATVSASSDMKDRPPAGQPLPPARHGAAIWKPAV